MEYVDPIPFALPVPKYPIPKESHLNFLKPGSQEVLTRPMHIPEYMPPMQPEPEEEPATSIEENSAEDVNGAVKDELMLSPTAGTSGLGQQPFFKRPSDFPLPPGSSEAQRRLKFDGTEGLKETREISSVIMTTSGFISPAREGKLPDSKPPIIIPDKRPSPPPPSVIVAPLPVSNMDNKFEEKTTKKKSHDLEKKEKKKVKKELFQPPPLSVPSICTPMETLSRQPPLPIVPVPVPISHQQKPPLPPAQQFPSTFPEDIKPTLPIAPPTVPRKPGRPRKSESLTSGPAAQKDKVKKPKNPDAKLIKQIKKQVAAGNLPPMPIQDLLHLVKSQNVKLPFNVPPGPLPTQIPRHVAQQHSGQFMSSGPVMNHPPGPPGQLVFPQKMTQPMMSGTHFEGKVSSESEKSKLNIFKKMPSSSKMVHHDFPSASTSMMKSEMYPGGVSEMSPQKPKFNPSNFEFPTTPINMAMNKVLEYNRSPIDDLTMPTTPQYMPRTPEIKGSLWNKNKDEQKKKKEKPEKKMKKIKTPPLMPFFNPGPDLQNPMNRMTLPGMQGFPQMPQSSTSMQQQPRFPFFPNLIPSGPGLIPNNAFFPGPFGSAQFGAPPFNMSSLFPGDIIQNLNKIRTQLNHVSSSSSPAKEKFPEPPPMEMKQAHCNVPPLLPPTVLETSHSPTKTKIRTISPPSLMKLPKDTVAIPIEPTGIPQHPLPSRMSPVLSKKLTLEKLDEISVKTEFKHTPHKDNPPTAIPSTSVNFDTVDLTSPKPEPGSKDKEEKESKKDKKLKKKSKKKDKIKEKDSSSSKDRSERKKDKEERKREKKEKRREKERLAMEQNKLLSSNTDSIDNSDSSLASVPKLTLKLGVTSDSRPNTPDIPKKM